MISGVSYDVIETRGVFKAENERYYEIAERKGKKYFIKNWTKDHFIRGILEYKNTVQLDHAYIIKPVNFGINQERTEASIVFPYLEGHNLITVESLTAAEGALIMQQINDVVFYLSSRGYVDDKFTETDQYYRDNMHNVMDAGDLRIRYDLSAPNIIWKPWRPGIILVDFERHDVPLMDAIHQIKDHIDSITKQE